MRYVIALGGNAVVDKRSIETAAKAIAKLSLEGNEIVVTHGNGPQVGELAIAEHENLAILTAQTEAWIGITLEESIARALEEKGKKNAYSIPEVVLTKTIVDRSDGAFRNPTKPIGQFYTKKQADVLAKRGFKMKGLIGGYRRVVPSPAPKGIVEKKIILDLLKQRRIVIACGGGGIPVCKDGNELSFADAVIDKDSASSLLAREIKADYFIILTNVDGVYINFKKKNQKRLSKITSQKLEEYLKSGQFEAGSMAPKVKACIDFSRSAHKESIIGNINKAGKILESKAATVITPH